MVGPSPREGEPAGQQMFLNLDYLDTGGFFFTNVWMMQIVPWMAVDRSQMSWLQTVALRTSPLPLLGCLVEELDETMSRSWASVSSGLEHLSKSSVASGRGTK